MRVEWLLIVLLAGCGSGLNTPGTAALCDTSLSFSSDIAPIVARTGAGHCTDCHGGLYDTKSGIQGNRNKVYQKVQSGSMPTDNSGFKDSADGKKFLGWAACTSLK